MPPLCSNPKKNISLPSPNPSPSSPLSIPETSLFSMVEANPSLHLLLLLLLLITAPNGICCLEEERVLVTLQKLQWGEKSSSQFSSPHGSGREKKTAAILEMKHPIYSSDTLHNLEHRLQKLLLSDEARVFSLQSQIQFAASLRKRRHQSVAQIPLTSGVALQSLNYIVTIQFGGKDMTVIVDTGSDLTWTQCKPCTYCYNQQDPLFDPSTSSSYHSIPCHSTSCTSLPSSTGVSSTCGLDRSSCNYALSYGDGSYTRGVLAREQIGLGGTIIRKFVFGCGRSNHGLFGGTSGLVGLGRSQLSLVAQTKAQFGGVFSYCLPSRVYNSSGNLVLGSDPSIYRNTTPITYTRMISEPRQAPFYFLNLTGLRVGGVDLGFTNGIRVLIDSGTVISRLVPSVYRAVRAEFVRQFSGYPPATGFSILDTCYDLSGYEEVRVPKLGLGFEGGVEVNMDVTGMFYFVKKDASQVCLAIASLSDEETVGIIGNYQQKNQRIVYDTVGSS